MCLNENRMLLDAANNAGKQPLLIRPSNDGPSIDMKGKLLINKKVSPQYYCAENVPSKKVVYMY